jgi:hypothetical protein
VTPLVNLLDIAVLNASVIIDRSMKIRVRNGPLNCVMSCYLSSPRAASNGTAPSAYCRFKQENLLSKHDTAK